MEITGILPTYNRAHLIQRAIESMLNQSLPLAELIVVDDGSDDGTWQVIRGYGERVRYIFQENAGGGAARNRGVEEARTPWVAFLDSDDLWTSDHLARIAGAIGSTSGCADLYFDDTMHHCGRESVSRWELAGFEMQEVEYLLNHDGTAWMMMEHQPVMLQTSVIRRSRFMEMGGFWEELRTAHDTHFFLRLGIGRPVCAVAGVGAIQTEDEVAANRLTARFGPVKLNRVLNTARLFNDILERYPQLGPEYRSLLREWVFGARWRASRMYWGEGDLLRCLGKAWEAFQYEPRRFAEKFNPVRFFTSAVRRVKPTA